MAYVWRVEDREGTGMYRTSGDANFGYIVQDEVGGKNSLRFHPNPLWADTELGFCDVEERYQWFFGFASMKQMRKWIFRAKWRKTLADAGMFLVQYEVPDEFFRKSKHQAIFYKDHSRMVLKKRVDWADRKVK